MDERGYPAPEAVERFADPDLRRQLAELTPQQDRTVQADGSILLGTISHRLRETILEAIRHRLLGGQLVATGLEEVPGSAVPVEIPKGRWRDADFDEGFDVWYRGKLAYTDVWIREAMDSQVTIEFTHDSSFTNVTVRGLTFKLGQKQAMVVRRLYEARLTAEPWVHGKRLMEGIGTSRVGHLFKSKPNWIELITTGRNGLYRLNC